MLTIGSLFSGVGGLELGLERAGLGPVMWQAEKDPYCRTVLARHWPAATRYADVRSVDGGAARVDVVCGGFPCQPVSVAGKRLAQADERWLWPEFARIVRELQPAIVVVENVPGLRSAGLRDVLADLAALGFDAEWSTLAASDAGAPHIRRRLFVVATHPDRISIREQPGWLSRACRAQAALACAHGEARALADPNREGQLQPSRSFGEIRGWAGDSGWRHAPSPLRRVDDGVPMRLDGGDGGTRRCAGKASNGIEAPDGWRIAALGNAVVPQVAETVGRALMTAVSRGSSRGSVDENGNAASEGGAETSEIAGEIAKRANGLEPSTFSLGSKRPLSAEGGNAENVGDLKSGMGANGDEK